MCPGCFPLLTLTAGAGGSPRLVGRAFTREVLRAGGSGRGAEFVSRSSALALAGLCLRGVVWWFASARAIVMLIRAHRKYARRRRSLLRLAEARASVINIRHDDH